MAQKERKRKKNNHKYSGQKIITNIVDKIKTCMQEYASAFDGKGKFTLLGTDIGHQPSTHKKRN